MHRRNILGGILTIPMISRGEERSVDMASIIVDNSSVTIYPKTAAVTEQQLGFTAHSVRVDNPTAAYYYLPDQNIYIPPFQTGVVIALTGTQKAFIKYQSPSTYTNPPTLQGAASFTYSGTATNNDSGVQLAGASSGRQVLRSKVSLIVSNTVVFVLPTPAPNGVRCIPIFDSAYTPPPCTLQISVRYPPDSDGIAIFNTVWRRDGWIPWGNNGGAQVGPTIEAKMPSLPAQSQLEFFYANGATSAISLLLVY